MADVKRRKKKSTITFGAPLVIVPVERFKVPKLKLSVKPIPNTQGPVRDPAADKAERERLKRLRKKMFRRDI